MRQISVSTDVFSRIWALRATGEESEDAILLRVLRSPPSKALHTERTLGLNMMAQIEKSSVGSAPRKVRWIDDVEKALHELDREASLSEIYKLVMGIRKASGRSLPASSEAIIRRTLEENSADSDSFKGINLFRMTRGKWAGYWALR